MASVEADQAAMAASEQITASTESFTVYELHTSTGTVIREYLSLDGNVFAVVWQGPNLPNLRQILGEHYMQYTEVAQKHHDGNNHVSVRLPDLVVESSGRMRAFFGRAYLPRSLPQGVKITEIQ